MSDSIFMLADDGGLTEMTSAPYDTEADLQKLLADHVHLLPGAQINRDRPRRWLLIKREAGIPNQEGGAAWWAVDHLVVDQDAIPTFVEVKRASDTRARREVVAQMLDYAANGSAFWTPDQLRRWFEGDDADAASQRLAALLDSADDDPETAAATFWDAVGANLREGKIRLVFVADEIPATLQRLVEFLNEQMPRLEVLAVEIRQYRTTGRKSGAFVPRLIGQTSRAQAAKEQASSTRRSSPWTADAVLDWIARTGDEDAAVAAAVRDWAETHHLEIAGGTGVSYPSIIMSVDTGRPRSRHRGVLALYGSPAGEPPMLEIRVKRMCRTPPYNRAEDRARLISDLKRLGIPRLDNEADLAGKRPNIPLSQLSGGRVQRLLALVDRWTDDVRAHAGEPEPASDS